MKVDEERWSRRHVRVTRLPKVTDGNEKEKDQKCPERNTGSKDHESDARRFQKILITNKKH